MKHNRLSKIFGVLIVAVMLLTACAPTVSQPIATPPTAAPPTQGAAPTSVPPTAVPPTAVPTAVPPTAVPPTTAPAKKTIIIGTTDKIASLDPGDAYAVHDWEILLNVNDGLLRFKPGTTDLQPVLATGMPTISADGLTYTFTLKDGIKFADGTPLDATMYVAQLNRLLTIGPKCPNDVADSLAIPYVKSIAAPDAKTIVFTLKVPVAFFPQILALPPYVSSDAKIFPADKCELFPTAPIYGTGAWYISQYNQSEQMVLEPNPYYTGDMKPQVDQIIIKFYSDANTMSLAVQSGEIDVAWRILSPEQLTPLKSVANLTVGDVNGGGIRFLVINHTMAPTNDPNVDKAIASAIDRNAIVDTVYGGNVLPLYSMVPPGFLGATDAFDTTYASPNLDAAKKYLEASGYSASNPLKLDVWYPPEHYGASTVAAMQLIKTQLEATGEIQVNLQAQEWSTYITSLTGGKAYPVGILGWFFDYPDSSNYLDPFVYNKGEGTNVTVPQEGSSYGIPITGTFGTDATNLVNLLNQADTETDQTKRADLYKQAQQIAADMVLTVPLYFVAEHVVFRNTIQGSSAFPYPEVLNIGPTIEFWYSLLTKTP
jgi:peptide/nickel transport system substrate-binding protein